MDNRYTSVKDRVLQSIKRLRDAGVSVDEAMVDSIIMDLTRLGDDASIDEEIYSRERAALARKEAITLLEKPMTIAHNLQSLPVEHLGITINSQDIDLMMIATASNFQELEEVMKNITNIGLLPGFGEGDFESYRAQLYKAYQDALVPRNEWIIDDKIDSKKKIERLFESGVFTSEEEAEIASEVIKAGGSSSEIILRLKEVFSEEKIKLIVHTLRDFTPIEKEGIKAMDIASAQAMYEQIKYSYDSITIDEEAKYGKLILADGSYDDKHLVKALEFARSLGKTVRINTLFFYMDCPNEIYELSNEGSERIVSADIAREALSYYVRNVATTLSRYTDVVRSVDVFNELLNRYQLFSEVPYDTRDRVDANDDNTKAGWLKHLDIDDICRIIGEAREILPDMDFMYNDDNLTDPKKIEATKQLLTKIRDHNMGDKPLIDSIGTQMHLSNDTSKEEIREMIIGLSKFNLPIEITEFDLAMTSGMEGLTPEEIEYVRQMKINQVYEVVAELSHEYPIRGFTIWSKTDSQNFRVHIGNEIAHKRGETFTSTYHGGFLTEEMLPKSSQYAKSLRSQNFNYHTHTKRCGHADDFDDYAYVVAARNSGLTRLGFSDHLAFTSLENWDPNGRMHVDDIDGYIESIRTLQKNNPDMEILCGFEADYSAMRKQFLCEVRDKCDYMILGQHSFTDKLSSSLGDGDPNYPMKYARLLCEAMDTGIFDIVAHPDLFMQYRDSFANDEDRALFMSQVSDASYMICRKAKELGIPLELNAAGLKKGTLSDGEYGYPHSAFWKIAAEVGVSVLYGVDAHHPGQILAIDEDRKIIESVIDTSKLMLVGNDYDPAVARENNPHLQTLFNDTKSTSVTYETALAEVIVETSGVGVGESRDPKEQIDANVRRFQSKLLATEEKKAERFESKRKEITSDATLSDSERDALLTKLSLVEQRAKKTATERKEAFARVSESVEKAQELGCESKEEYSLVVGYLTEEKTQTDPSKTMTATMGIESFCESKRNENIPVDTNTSTNESPKVYTYSDNSGSSSNGSGDGGYTNSINLLLVVGLLVIFGIILGIMLT